MALGSRRKQNIVWVILAIAFIYLLKLLQLQIIDKEYKITAENNAFRYVVQYPPRGLILDRDGRLIVSNTNSYDITITPIEVKEFDTLALCSLLDLDPKMVKEKLKYYRENKRKIGYQSFPFVKQLSAERYSYFLEKEHNFPGFNVITRTVRNYPFKGGANLLGYITEVDSASLARDSHYKLGDYTGRTGIEQSYEKLLRGEKGYQIYYRDVHNKLQSNFAQGKYDKASIPGEDITSSIDAPLQQYGEYLLKNKVGSVVAIEPSSGEILALVTAPGIEVKQLANINREYAQLVADPYKPMFNRATMSPYPPGSVFKVVNALIALQEGVAQKESRHSCFGRYNVGKGVACHSHFSPVDLPQSIMVSCNTYYCILFRAIIDNPHYNSVREGFERWRQFVESFGFGKPLGSDLPGEQGGTLPSSEGYDKIHGYNRWRSLSILSLAIGQGELGTTPLHLANLAATIANRGYYHTPHLIKHPLDSLLESRYNRRHYTLIDTTHFEAVVEGMSLAVNSPVGSGATATIAAIPGIEVCGKTGTAQNPHGRDHSVFIAFAPKENPKIAIAAFIENAGFGATWAAPISSLMIEKYLTGEISRHYLEERITGANLMGGVPHPR
ncbi:MAG: penicillin-binding transpeptidase domain-containing protein [Bacteroidales bacterium]